MTQLIETFNIVTFQANTSTQTFLPGKAPGFPGIYLDDSSPGYHQDETCVPKLSRTHQEILLRFTGKSPAQYICRIYIFIITSINDIIKTHTWFCL